MSDQHPTEQSTDALVPGPINKLVVVVVNDRDVRNLRDALIGAGYRFTHLGSTGGFLRQGNATLLIGVAEEQVEPLVELLSEHCQAREQVVRVQSPGIQMYANPLAGAVTVQVGGALIFVLPVEQSIKL